MWHDNDFIYCVDSTIDEILFEWNEALMNMNMDHEFGMIGLISG